MKQRPFAVVGFSYLAAQAVAVFFGLEISLAFLAAALIALAAYFIIGKMRNAVISCVLVCLIFANAVYCLHDLARIRPMSALEGTSTYITGEIIKDPYESNGRYYYIVESYTNIDETTPINFNVRISSQSKLNAEISDVISAHVVFDKAVSSLPFASRSQLLAKGVTVTAHIDKEYSVAVFKNEGDFKRVFSSVRDSLGDSALRLLGPQCGGLLCAVLLGDTSHLESSVISDFRISGLSHLLAVSGMHLSILTMALTMLLRYLCIKRNLINISAIAFVLMFMATAGFGASVVRAGIMMILMLAADIFERESDSLNSLGFAVLLLCLSNPTAAADSGFILSVSSTLGIILMHEPISKRLAAFIKEPKSRKGKFLHSLAQALSLDISSALFTLPFSMIWFGSVSLISPLANIVCVAPASGFLTIGAAASLLNMIPQVGAYIAYIPSLIAWFIGKLLLIETELFASVPNAGVLVNYDFLPTFFIGTIILVFLTTLLFNKKEVKRFSAVMLCAAFCLQALLCGIAVERIKEANESSITVYSVEEGIAVALNSKGRTVLIGSGGDSYFVRQMMLELEKNNIGNIDALFLPSLDEYAAGSADLIIERFGPESIFAQSEGEFDYEVLSAAKKNGSDVYNIENCVYKDVENGISVSCFADSSGLVWVYAKVEDLSVIICPQQGDCLQLPSEMRTADIAILSSGKQINAAYLSATAYIVSADRRNSAEAKLLLEYRGIENIYATGTEGSLMIEEKNGKILLGGVAYAGY